MKNTIFAILLSGCATVSGPEISEHLFSDVEIKMWGAEETYKTVVVRNPSPNKMVFHLRCLNTTEYVARWMPYYDFDVVVKPQSETRFLAEYPVKYKHVQMCTVRSKERVE